HIDGKLILDDQLTCAREFKFTATVGQKIRIQTLRKRHNPDSPIATWSEIGEFQARIKSTDNPPEPDLIPALTIEKAVKISWQTLLGRRYILQSSSNLSNWQNVGAAFTGNGKEYSQYVDVNTYSSKYFRLLIP
ncbi:hypothetical protein OAM21_04215, partial [Verrucomicrobia bacterium]|nr:hypothetical protein [Verrucomicrobiota bacterium]